MGTIKTKGLVLHEMPIGEYDKRLIIFTKELGKITAFAKGAKKTNSKLLAGSQIFSYGDFIIYKGRNSYQVNQVELIESFHNLRNNMDALVYSLYVLEFVEYITTENTQDHELMRLTLKALKQLELGKNDYELIIKIFELKAMSFVGYAPWVSDCVSCNNPNELLFFSVKQGGLICNNCYKDDNECLKISNGTKYTLQYILNQPIEKIFQFSLESNILFEIKLVINKIIEYNLNKKFKSLEFLKTQY